jgi:hypothetical protein
MKTRSPPFILNKPINKINYRRRIIMNYKLLCFIMLFSLTLISADWYVPVVAKADGANGSHWQTSLALYNAGHKDFTATISFLPTGSGGSQNQKEFLIKAGEYLYFDDILSEFSVLGSGALKISAPDYSASNLGVVVKVYNLTENGRFGQGINVLQENRILDAPVEYFLILPENEDEERFNFGLLSLDNSSLKFQLLDRYGNLIKEVEKTYSPLFHIQYNQGYKDFFQTDQRGYVIKGILTEGKVILYGSQVDNKTNDGAFYLAQNLKSNEPPYLEGVDAASDGTIDFKDENMDNILDETIYFNEGYPFDYLFSIKAKDPEGDPVTFKILNPPKGMVLLSPQEGKIYYDPDKGDVNQRINLEVELNDGLGKSICQIPLQVIP